jgi:hypothetical protein
MMGIIRPLSLRVVVMAARPEQLMRYLRRLVTRPASGPESDPVLLARFTRDRDEAAFAALVARHGRMVLGVCRRVLRDHQAAEDAAQATWLVLARKASALRRPEGLAAWLHGVARQVALNARRADERHRQAEAQNALPVPVVSRPDPLDARGRRARGCHLGWRCWPREE